MKKVELVFIPSPGLSHLVSTVEAAKLLLNRDRRLAVTVLIANLPNNTSVDRYTQQTSSDPNTSPRLRLLHLPDDHDSSQPSSIVPHEFNDKQTNHVREELSNLIQRSQSDDSQVAGLVLDMFCTKFIQVGREFGLHSYVFFTSAACGLGLSQHLATLRFEHNQHLTQYNIELSVPYFKEPLPYEALPPVLREGGPAADGLLSFFHRIREAKGVMVNTFYELESHAIDSLNSDGKTPKVYPVGPILNQSGWTFDDDGDDVKKWLDDQAENSVVFLCFGTMGSLEQTQVREIALALENCECRFLWSLRKPGEVEYKDFNQVLPEGFLETTKGVGKVMGWAAQVAVLSHPAVGGFVSHCGWNSTLESLWFGVPVAAFPLYAEQHMNAFYLVRELGMAEMISLEYEMESRGGEPPKVVVWEDIAAAIRRLMAGEVREKVKEMQKKARASMEEGGSSYNAHNLFIEDVIRNLA